MRKKCAWEASLFPGVILMPLDVQRWSHSEVFRSGWLSLRLCIQTSKLISWLEMGGDKLECREWLTKTLERHCLFQQRLAFIHSALHLSIHFKISKIILGARYAQSMGLATWTYKWFIWLTNYKGPTRAVGYMLCKKEDPMHWGQVTWGSTLHPTYFWFSVFHLAADFPNLLRGAPEREVWACGKGAIMRQQLSRQASHLSLPNLWLRCFHFTCCVPLSDSTGRSQWLNHLKIMILGLAIFSAHWVVCIP